MYPWDHKESPNLQEGAHQMWSLDLRALSLHNYDWNEPLFFIKHSFGSTQSIVNELRQPPCFNLWNFTHINPSVTEITFVTIHFLRHMTDPQVTLLFFTRRMNNLFFGTPWTLHNSIRATCVYFFSYLVYLSPYNMDIILAYGKKKKKIK